jgi:hypothetical protein
MQKATGPGRIITHPNAPKGGLRAGLANFDIEGHDLKGDHKTFLDTRIVPMLVGARARVWLQGQTSSSGTAAFNEALSKRRCESVTDHLRSRGVNQPQIVPSWVGESIASVSMRERSDDRVVWVLAAPLIAPPPPAPAQPPVQTTTPRNTKFKLRVIGGLSGGGKFGVDPLFIQIWDEKNAVSSLYTYTGVAAGWSYKPISTTLEGPWNDFDTTGEVAVDEFAGWARFTSASAGSKSFNYFNMMSMPRGTATSPNPLDISTGITVGITISTGAGKMILQRTEPYRGL